MPSPAIDCELSYRLLAAKPQRIADVIAFVLSATASAIAGAFPAMGRA
jgi:hypothetical protein